MWTIGGLTSLVSGVYIFQGVLERIRNKKIIKMLKQGQISSIDDIMKNLKNPNNLSGFYSQKNNEDFDVLFHGNVALSGNKRPIRMVDHGLNLDLLSLVKKII